MKIRKNKTYGRVMLPEMVLQQPFNEHLIISLNMYIIVKTQLYINHLKFHYLKSCHLLIDDNLYLFNIS